MTKEPDSFQRMVEAIRQDKVNSEDFQAGYQAPLVDCLTELQRLRTDPTTRFTGYAFEQWLTQALAEGRKG